MHSVQYDLRVLLNVSNSNLFGFFFIVIAFKMCMPNVLVLIWVLWCDYIEGQGLAWFLIVFAASLRSLRAIFNILFHVLNIPEQAWKHGTNVISLLYPYLQYIPRTLFVCTKKDNKIYFRKSEMDMITIVFKQMDLSLYLRFDRLTCLVSCITILSMTTTYIFSTNQIDWHGISEILLEMALTFTI